MYDEMKEYKFGKARFWFGWIICALLFCGSLCGCAGSAEDKNLLIQQQFDTRMEELFREEVQSDSITLHYTLADPEEYGIEAAPVSLGEYDEDSYQQGVREAQELLAELAGYEYESLREDQQLTYDILEYSLEQRLAGEEFYLYEKMLGPTTGLQAQLPILLAEYRFYDREDVQKYLKLLPCVETCYRDILKREQERAEAGLFLADQTVKEIIRQCKDFIGVPEKNLLITGFRSRLDTLDGPNEDEKLAWEYENRRLVEKHVIPAYEELITGLRELKGSGANEKGLCYLPKGKEYYAWLIGQNTGSDWTVEEMTDRLDQVIRESIDRMTEICQKEPMILTDLDSLTWPETDPDSILRHLQEAMQEDYPVTQEVQWTVKYVDPSLEDHVSPAFFLTPAMDRWEELTIYVNRSERNGNMEGLFTTLAHEGFPGHLYESVYFNQKEFAPIRQLLSFGGYSEGWATYAEYQAYVYGELPEEQAELLRLSDLVVLAICGRVDIGIHQEGWSLTDTYAYLKRYGLVQEEKEAERIYWSSIGDPAGTLDYIIGYLEFTEMRQDAEKQWRAEQNGVFSAKEYHTRLLGLGPAPFPILRKWMGLREGESAK